MDQYKKRIITPTNIYAPNTRAPQYIKQTLTDTKGESDNKTIIVGDFNTPLTSVDRSSWQNLQGNSGLIWHIRPSGLNRYLLNIPYKNCRIHILFKYTWNVLQDRSYARAQKILNKFKRTEIISSIFSDHNSMKLEINYRKKMGKNQIHGK